MNINVRKVNRVEGPFGDVSELKGKSPQPNRSQARNKEDFKLEFEKACEKIKEQERK